MSTKVTVVNGDIASYTSDALITAINSSGLWAGGIDRVILESAGPQYHEQAQRAMPLSHGQVVVAHQLHPHNGRFANVIFVVDDLEGRLRDIVRNGLETASLRQMTSVVLPTIRMGVMLGIVEQTVQEAIDELVIAIAEFIKFHPESTLDQITVVVYNNPALEAMVREMMARTLVS